MVEIIAVSDEPFVSILPSFKLTLRNEIPESVIHIGYWSLLLLP